MFRCFSLCTILNLSHSNIHRSVTWSFFDVQKLKSTQNGVEFNFLKDRIHSSYIKPLEMGKIAIVGDRE